MSAETIARAAAVLGDRARRDVPLGPFTTYGVGGPAALLLENCGPDDLALAREAVAASGVPVLIIGRGSNLLVADRGFPGLALTLGEDFAAIHREDEETLVRAGGGLSLPVLARRTAALGLRGLEWAVGVPGTVGGGVRMNAGGHGSDVAATLVRVWLFDLAGGGGGGAVEVPVADLDLGYRRSAVGPAQVVVAAEFSLTRGDRAEAEAEIAAVVRWRREHQPGGSNAGSVFANPPGDSAGRLIEAAGLRGHRRASASVSPKHANFFQVDAGGSADDVRALIEEVQTTVKSRFGVELTLENRLVGFDVSTSSGG
ncbi:MAG TPA: UDP-N-acetylmuramate dehydrogenase [Acidimicrobiales bacterium]|nr:UDP-N-acetylmuramate dehydrogenase [Acidimicrobiales bacterium]HWI03511.1 UDP-N-acetylmuramate dehydrogenase [Acidimicrobiales bacterium]